MIKSTGLGSRQPQADRQPHCLLAMLSFSSAELTAPEERGKDDTDGECCKRSTDDVF